MKIEGKIMLVPPNVLVELCPICLITQTNINSITTIHHSRVSVQVTH